jgi:hypothetical protein
VREEGELVRRLERLRRAGERLVGVAFLARRGTRSARELLVLLQYFGRRKTKGVAFVPLGGERVAPFLRRPVVGGEHGDAVRRRDQLDQCIGCGCLSINNCWLRNPWDKLGAQGPGAGLLER